MISLQRDDSQAIEEGNPLRALKNLHIKRSQSKLTR
jgi:hypothetical protein